MRISLKRIAKETLQIVDEGKYVAPSGKSIEFREEQLAAIAGTRLYTPEQGRFLLEAPSSCNETNQPTKIEVTDETTQVAAQRLVKAEQTHDLVLLNYASARNPGGGFINGAKAQEEDLARSSGLYPCLLTQPTYYEANRATKSLLYTDHAIYSPQVPWFRVRNRELLEEVFLASAITAPAPNAGQVLRQISDAQSAIEQALRHRAGLILAIARHNGHRALLLGAWGCGVFGNNPNLVADAFGQWLESPTFQHCFERVTFAIYDPTRARRTLQAFQKRFLNNVPLSDA